MADSSVTGSKKTYFDGFDFEPFEEGSSLIWSDSTNPNTFSDSRERINGVPYKKPDQAQEMINVDPDILKSVMKPTESGNYESSIHEMISVDPNTLKDVKKPIENNQEYSGVTIGTDKIRDRINGVPYKKPDQAQEMINVDPNTLKSVMKPLESGNYESSIHEVLSVDPDTLKSVMKPIGDLKEYIYDSGINYSNIEPLTTTLEYSSAEEMNNIREFVDGIDGLIKDIAVLNNDSYGIRGSFGQAIAYSSDVCKENMTSLKKYAEENMTPALKQVGEYEANDTEIKRIISPIAGDISKVKFMDDGTISVPNLSSPTDKFTIAKAEEYYKRNKTIRENLESLSNDRINKAG